MAELGVERFIYFRLEDLSGNPVAGRAPSSFAVIFTRNDLAAPDTLIISEIGAGRYEAQYTPSSPGVDYLEIYDAAAEARIVDVEVIDPGASYVPLSADYPAVGALKGTYPGTIYVFLYSDWQAGNQDISYAQGQSQLNTDGSWKSVIYVLAETYTVVVVQGSSVAVIAPRLLVGS